MCVCIYAWAALDQRITIQEKPCDIDTISCNAVAKWRQRLRASVQAEGGHFKHLP